MGQRDTSFQLDERLAQNARPPFAARFIYRPWPLPTWAIRDASGREIGRANTRAGARLGVRELYSAQGAQASS